MENKERVEFFLSQQARSLVYKLNEEIDKGNDMFAFTTALMLAMFKDFIDLCFFALKVKLAATGIGIAIVLPLALFAWATGVFLTVFIYFFLLGKGWCKRMRLRIIYWILGFFVANFPVFSALPINTLLVLYAWRLVRKRGLQASRDLGEINIKTRKDLLELERQYLSA